MSFRFRIAAWVVLSCCLMIAVMMYVGHLQIEEELRADRSDPTHPVNPDWVLHNSCSEEEIQEILSEMLHGWALAAVPLVGLSLVAGLLLAKRSLRSVHDINRQISAMRPESLHGGIVVLDADPEISNLAEHLNILLDKAGFAYREMSEFSSRVAHELRTPLMLLRMRLEHAPPGMPPTFQEELQDEVARLSRFVERSLLAAKAEQGVLVASAVRFSLSSLLRELVEDYRFLADVSSRVMISELADDLWIQADEDLLKQAMHGLLENAVRYAHTVIHVICGVHDGRVVLEIRNDCDALSMATPGLGLGLRLVRRICDVSGFSFEVVRGDREFAVRMGFVAVE